MPKKKNSNISNPHDKLFKAVFTRRDEAIAFLAGALPADVFARIKPESIKLINSSYISRDLQESMSDVVYEAAFEDFPIKLAFIIEHKSEMEAYPFLQFLLYFVNCINVQIKQKKKNEALRLALPVIIVLYHGKNTWRVKAVHEYFDNVPTAIQRFIPAFDYLMVNLREDSYHKIKARFDSLILRMSLMTLKGVYETESYRQQLSLVFDGIEQLYISENFPEIMDTLLLYIFDQLEIDTDKLHELINTKTKQGGQQIMTTAAKLRQEGRQEGIEVGIETGIERGIKKANLLSAIKGIKEELDNRTISIITTLTEKEIEELRIALNERGEKLMEEINAM